MNLKFIVSFQLLFLAMMGLNMLGLEIPILTQVIAVIYLLFIPGNIILEVLKLHKLGSLEKLLYSVGLSIAFLMFIGAFTNSVYQLFSLSNPISSMPLIFTISISVIILCILSYKRNKDFSELNSFSITGELSFLRERPLAMILCFLPILTVLGTYLMNFYNNNILLMILLLILSMMPILVVFDRIPKKMYAISLFVISISLLYHKSLISMYLLGADIHIEYYFSNLVNENSFWNPIHPYLDNAMLSVVMLPPVLSKICNISLIWVFKLVVPLIFSLVPLGLYGVFQKQVDEKIAFLSSFFFISVFTFYSLYQIRQKIAELFFVLIMLVMINKRMGKGKRSVLFVIFGFSLAVSHYGLSYIYMFLLIFTLLMGYSVTKVSTIIGLSRLNFSGILGNIASFLKSSRNTAVTLSDSLIYVIFSLSWYVYVSSSRTFNVIVNIGNQIISSVVTEFLNPRYVQGLDILIAGTQSPLHEALKYLHLISILFIVVGFLTFILRYKSFKISKEFGIFSLLSFAICLAGVTVPHFSSQLRTERLYHITLLLLAPYCIVGGITIFHGFRKAFRIRGKSESVRGSIKILSIFLCMFLLFNSGFVFEIADDVPISISLNNSIDFPRFNNKEVYGAEWLAEMNTGSNIYADHNGKYLLYQFDFENVKVFWGETEDIAPSAYIYFRSLNVRGTIRKSEQESQNINLNNSTFFTRNIIMTDKIYDNGDAQIYR